ncbi:MAG: 5-(carboxyamino)imidazole ribonucleotide mutase [Deltaproteobacteria bacterium]|nr:5-(carboxyamino)imidazole ribonucleotide mutase [Deltaproteobacteria bacterium]
MAQPVVSIVMGSDSDLTVMKEAGAVLEEFGVAHEFVVSSAHRAPEKTAAHAKGLLARGIRVVIAAAGYSAHLAGVMAAYTTLPVIGVPLAASPLAGMDALLAMGQMPAGVPVATMTIGVTGARNAALYAVAILALQDGGLAKRLQAYRRKLAAAVDAKDRAVRGGPK